MGKKLLVLVFLAATSIFFLPSVSRAETNRETSVTVSEFNANPFYQRRWRNRRRWENRRYNRRNYRRDRRPRYVRQVYYRNGRRYVRVIRVY